MKEPPYDGLEKFIGDVVPRTALLLKGRAGKIRKSLEIQYVANNLIRGGSALVVLSRMTPSRYMTVLEKKGVDVERCKEEDRLVFVDWYSYYKERIIGIEEENNIIRSNRDILNLSISVNKAIKLLSDNGSKVAVVDCIEKAVNIFGWDTVYEYCTKIIEKLKDSEFAVLYFVEKELDDEKTNSLYSISDGIIQLEESDESDSIKLVSLGEEYSDTDRYPITVDENILQITTSADKSLKTGGKKGVGRANGKSNGEGNREKKSRVNGRTNGKANGRINGRVNGRENGRVNGKTEGSINEEETSPEEMTRDYEGDENVTSLSAEDGLINGLGGVSGPSIGLPASSTDEDMSLPAEDGLVNGMSGAPTMVSRDEPVEDTLDISGGGGGGGEPLKPRGGGISWFKKGFGTIIIMLFLLFIPILLNILYVPVEEGISIDGDFDDWKGVRAYFDTPETEFDDGSIDIREYRLTKEGGYLYVYTRVNESLFDSESGVDSLRCFISLSDDLGYEVAGIRAQYFLEIYGWEGDLGGTALYEFNESNQKDDWNGFERKGGGRVEYEDNILETRIWVGELQYEASPKVIIHTQSGDYSDVSEGEVIPGEDSIVAQVQKFGPHLVDQGQEVPILKLDAFSLSGEAVLDNITIGYNQRSEGYIESVYIYEGGNYTGSLEDIDPIAQSDDFDGNVDLSTRQVLNSTPKEYIISADISDDAPDGSVVGLYVDDIGSAEGTATVQKTRLDNIYVGSIPEEPRIDGAFADWWDQPVETDPMDDLAPAGKWNPNIDIRNYSIADASTTNFMIDVDGNVLGGADVPYLRGRPPELVDSDRDGIPDTEDPMPNDFNNDGIPNDESLVNGLPDWDGDGEVDYPHGEDRWLNTTIPERPDIPTEYRNQTVSRYIGPVTLPVKTGEDYSRIFIDSDDDITTGYRAPWLSVGAEYMISISGRNMEVTASNYSEYIGGGTDWSWERLGDVEVALNDTALETALDLDSLGVGENYSVSYVSSDWENNLDATSSINSMVRSRGSKTGSKGGMRSGEVKKMSDSDTKTSDGGKERIEYLSEHKGGSLTASSTEESKELYLGGGDGLNTTISNNTVSTTISNEESNTWTQETPFSKSFNITSQTDVELYIEPTNGTAIFDEYPPDVTVSMGYGDTTIDNYTITELTRDRWYNFPLNTDGTAIPSGNSLWIDVYVDNAAAGWFGSDGYVDVYYDSSTYDSRAKMKTNTYVDVTSITTFNSTDRTDYFNPGDTVNIEGEIEDPFGAYDIAGAEIDIISPNGTYLVENGTMDLKKSEDDSKNFTYNYTLSDNASKGQYEIAVTGIESNGVTDELIHNFYVPPQLGVNLYPDQYDSGDPGKTIAYDISLENIGKKADIYDLHPSSSSRGWETRLLDRGDLVAKDQDGDGSWDWVDSSYDSDGDGDPDYQLSSQETKDLTVKKKIPSSANAGSDYTELVATSDTNSTIKDSVGFTTRTPKVKISKNLFLREGDDLYTMEGTSTQSMTISHADNHSWTQDPVFAKTFNHTSNAVPSLYIDPTEATGWFNGGWPDVTATLGYDTTEIGSYSIKEISSSGWYEFPIDGAGTSIPSGEALNLEVEVTSAWGGWGGDPGSIDLYYGSSQYNSTIKMGTDSYVNCDRVTTYNSSVQTDTFEAGEDVHVVGKISDPFGSYDITGAELSIFDPDGDVLVSNQSMALNETDPSSPSSWKKYDYTYQLSSDAKVGTYEALVKGTESDGTKDYERTKFFIPGNVSVEPDNNGTASPGTTVTYDHYINNTGLGADCYNLKVGSSQGWNVSVYADDGTLIGTDTGGDGTWDYVDPNYDFNDDGIPDTGLMTPGESMNFTVSIEVPGNAPNETVDTTTITGTSIFDSSASDSATDVTTIPEFPRLLVPVMIVFGLFFGSIAYRRWKKKHEVPEQSKEKVEDNSGGVPAEKEVAG